MKRAVFWDADVAAYRAALSAQDTIDWGDEDGPEVVLDRDVMRMSIHDSYEEMRDILSPDKVVACLSDLEGLNWRYSVYPQYKSNRDKTDRPALLVEAKLHIASEYGAVHKPRLEGDDVMGILATMPDGWGGWERIIYSIDKDMATIPGLLFDPGRHSEIQEVSLNMANRWHFIQGIAGDSTDGYPGAYMVGESGAGRLWDNGDYRVPYEHTFTRGAKAGTSTLRWRPANPENSNDRQDLWGAALKLYIYGHWRATGLLVGPEAVEPLALSQFRVARILRHGDFDAVTRAPILWHPDRLGDD